MDHVHNIRNMCVIAHVDHGTFPRSPGLGTARDGRAGRGGSQPTIRRGKMPGEDLNELELQLRRHGVLRPDRRRRLQLDPDPGGGVPGQGQHQGRDGCGGPHPSGDGGREGVSTDTPPNPFVPQASPP